MIKIKDSKEKQIKAIDKEMREAIEWTAYLKTIQYTFNAFKDNIEDRPWVRWLKMDNDTITIETTVSRFTIELVQDENDCILFNEIKEVKEENEK